MKLVTKVKTTGGFDKLARQLDRHFDVQLNKLARKIKPALKSVLSTSSRQRASFPTEYPRKLAGHLVKSVFSERAGKYAVRFGAQATIDNLEKGFEVRAQRTRYLAIPVSLEARTASTNGMGPRQAFGELDIEVTRVRGLPGKYLCLVSPREATNRQINNSSLTRLGVSNRVPRTYTEDDYEVHYVLVKRAKIPARKGLRAFAAENETMFVDLLGAPL